MEQPTFRLAAKPDKQHSICASIERGIKKVFSRSSGALKRGEKGFHVLTKKEDQNKSCFGCLLHSLTCAHEADNNPNKSFLWVSNQTIRGRGTHSCSVQQRQFVSNKFAHFHSRSIPFLPTYKSMLILLWISWEYITYSSSIQWYGFGVLLSKIPQESIQSVQHGFKEKATAL